MANWTNEPQPFGANRAPLLAGLSKTDGITPVPVAVDPANGQLQTNSAGGGGGGTSSSFGAAFPATGTAAGFSDGTNMQGPKVYDLDSGAGVDYVAGSSLRFAASGGSTAADTNSGAKSAATLRVVIATDQPQLTNKLLVTPDSVALPANQSVNVSQINAVTPLMGNGVTGTGSLRVTIASDNTAFSVNAAATLNAETTKVIGVVRNSDGAGNLLTSNSTTPAAHFALDSNITSILGTAPTTVGKLDVKGADGDVFVRQTTGSNLHTVLDSGTLTTLSTLTTVTNAVKVTGNAGGAFDAATNAAPPANALQIGGIASTALPAAFTATDLAPPMLDKFGRQVVLPFSIRDLTLPMTQLTLTASTAETSLIAAVASTFNDLVSLVVINTSATATQVDFRDSTAGTIRLSLYVPAGDTRGVSFTTPLPQNAVNTAWTAKCGTSVSSVIITGSYVANK